MGGGAGQRGGGALRGARVGADAPSAHARKTRPLSQGAWEKDEVRKHDSFDAFEEVFEIADAQKAS